MFLGVMLKFLTEEVVLGRYRWSVCVCVCVGERAHTLNLEFSPSLCTDAAVRLNPRAALLRPFPEAAR